MDIVATLEFYIKNNNLPGGVFLLGGMEWDAWLDYYHRKDPIRMYEYRVNGEYYYKGRKVKQI